jgi:hypothetical protein
MNNQGYLLRPLRASLTGSMPRGRAIYREVTISGGKYQNALKTPISKTCAPASTMLEAYLTAHEYSEPEPQ